MGDTTREKEIRAIIEVATLAIPKERDSRAFYLSAARRAPGDWSRKVFEDLAAEEGEHEARLRAIIKVLEEELGSS